MRLLTDKPFRQRLLTHVTDPVVRAFWETEFGPWPPKFKAEAIAPIQNKIGQFLSNPLMRSIVGQLLAEAKRRSGQLDRSRDERQGPLLCRQALPRFDAWRTRLITAERDGY